MSHYSVLLYEMEEKSMNYVITKFCVLFVKNMYFSNQSANMIVQY